MAGGNKKKKPKPPQEAFMDSDSESTATHISAVDQSWEFKVLTDRLVYPELQKVPKEIHQLLIELDSCAIEDAEVVVGKLLVLLDKYPALPQLYDLLRQWYEKSGQEAGQFQVIREMYDFFPEYFFVQVQYARLSIKSEEYVRIPEILDNVMSFEQLSKRHKEIQRSDLILYCTILGRYYYHQDEPEKSRFYYSVLQHYAPFADDTLILGHLLEADKPVD